MMEIISMSSAHSITPSSSYCWGLQLHYEKRGWFTRWFDSEDNRNKHERSLKQQHVKPLFIEKINP